MKGSRPDKMPVYGAGIEKETEGVTLVSTRHRPPAIPIAPLHSTVKGAEGGENLSGGRALSYRLLARGRAC